MYVERCRRPRTKYGEANWPRTSVAVADEGRGGAVDAATVLLALAVVDGHHLDAVADEALRRGIAVVDGEQDLAGAQGEQVDHVRVVGVVHLDPLDLELLERVEEPPRHPVDVHEGDALVDHEDLPVDVHGVAREVDLDEPDPLRGEDLLDLAHALLVLAIGEPDQGRVLIEPAEAPAFEETAAMNGAQDGHAELGDFSRDVGFFPAAALAGPGAHGPHPTDDGAA